MWVTAEPTKPLGHTGKGLAFSCGLQLQEGGGHHRAGSPVKMEEGDWLERRLMQCYSKRGWKARLGALGQRRV